MTTEPPAKRIKTNGYLSDTEVSSIISVVASTPSDTSTTIDVLTTAAAGVERLSTPTNSASNCYTIANLDGENDYELICYGMLVLSLKCSIDACRNTLSATTLFYCGSNGEVCVLGSDSSIGQLSSRDNELLHLFHQEALSIEMRLNLQEGLNLSLQELDKISAILYGPRKLGADVGRTLQDLNIYLQDPCNAAHDLPYWNPHRFSNSADLRTSYWWHMPEKAPVKEELLSAVDFLEAFTTGGDLKETEGSILLRTPLKTHQKQALTFMLGREQGWQLKGDSDIWGIHDSDGRRQFINRVGESRHDVPPLEFRGGILADTMGYGKTLEIISLIAYDKSAMETEKKHQLPRPKATLVVVPAPIMKSWTEELKKHLKSESITWRWHAGKSKLRQPSDIQDVDVVLITYTALASERRNKVNSLIFAHIWRRVVLDEAHCIKNSDGATSKAACELEAERRWAVSGTPIQNRLVELQSLLRFLRASPYNDKDVFNHQFVFAWQEGEATKAVERLRKLLSAIMLRRSDKQSMLPARTDMKRVLRFSELELEHYDKARGKALAIIDEVLDLDGPGNTYTNALQKINALRIICNNGKRSSSLTQVMDRSDSIIETDWNPSAAQKTLDQFPLLGLSVNCYRCRDPLDAASQQAMTRIDSVPTSPFDYPTKVSELIRDLGKLPGDVKSIVFSFWTSTLDICKEALDDAGIRCERVDGTVKPKEREKAFVRFQENTNTQVLLLSLSCGAVGLTLTAASRVYLMEPQWNPAIEEQALARVHRIGQTKEVTTIRFIIEDTIEKYVSDVQDDKKDIMSVLLASSSSSSRTKERREANVALRSYETFYNEFLTTGRRSMEKRTSHIVTGPIMETAKTIDNLALLGVSSYLR
ncbi:hypothetical protein PG985_014877 [Apiospora marii]|uniref:uncharacterized protein n=1 Tax=Apiospora marii TaxID=335849 RepID=UPI00312D9D56